MTQIYYRTTTDKETYFYSIPKQLERMRITSVSITEKTDNLITTYWLTIENANFNMSRKTIEQQLKESIYKRKVLIRFNPDLAQGTKIEGFYLGDFDGIRDNSTIEVTFDD